MKTKLSMFVNKLERFYPSVTFVTPFLAFDPDILQTKKAII